VVVVLIALVVIVLVRIPSDQKPPPVVVTEKNEQPAPIDILPGRPPEEKPSVKSVGQNAQASRGPSIGPGRTKAGRPSTKAVRPTAPPPTQPGALEPAPLNGDPTAVPRKVAVGERQVPTYKPTERSSGSESAGAGSGPTDSQIHAVVNRRENQLTIKTCYERALKRDDNIRSGRIETTVDVAPSGIVKSVALNAPPQFGGVEPCIKQAVKRWMFPASNDGYSTQFTLIMQGNL
jgi:hypothetical protein